MTASEDQRVYQLIYRSRSALTGSDATIDGEVDSILDQSARNNHRNGVTGALMFTASVFIQVLEGACSDIEQTFERICCDTRHIGVELISFSTIPARMFTNWDMHQVHANPALEALFRQLGDSPTREGNTADAVSRAVATMAASATNKYIEPACR